jgi:ABC-type branched-subunit amino acid transport system substrate-binding protein
MKLTRRSFVASTAATALIGLRPALAADEKVIRFGMPQDFTKIYTFVTAEYSQGQRDYFSLINGRGGVGGYKIVADVSDHANDLPRAIEAYERLKREGMVLCDPLSTPVARALVTRALEDKINLVTAFSGRSDAADGTVFPYVMPLSPNYWTQAGIIVDFFRQQDKDLKGKKIVLVHIDTPFGKEPIPIFKALSEKLGYTFETFPYTPPGNDQAAIWPQVRRAKPDWVVFWGAGVGQTTALSEAIRNGIPMDRMSSSVWISESDMEVVGKDATKGVLKFEPCRHPPGGRRERAGRRPGRQDRHRLLQLRSDDGRHHGGRRPRRCIEGAGRSGHRAVAQRGSDCHHGFHRRRPVAADDGDQRRPSRRRQGPHFALGWNEVRSADRLVLREPGRGVGGDQEIRRKLQDDRQVIRRRRAQSQQYRSRL